MDRPESDTLLALYRSDKCPQSWHPFLEHLRKDLTAGFVGVKVRVKSGGTQALDQWISDREAFTDVDTWRQWDPLSDLRDEMPVRYSDAVPERQFKQSHYYRKILHANNIRYGIAFRISNSEGAEIRIGCTRGADGLDFGDREVNYLQSVGPYLKENLERIAVFYRLQNQCDLLKSRSIAKKWGY